MAYKFTDNKEPTDKELAELMQAAINKANKRGEKAIVDFMEELAQKVFLLKQQEKSDVN